MKNTVKELAYIFNEDEEDIENEYYDMFGDEINVIELEDEYEDDLIVVVEDGIAKVYKIEREKI